MVKKWILCCVVLVATGSLMAENQRGASDRRRDLGGIVRGVTGSIDPNRSHGEPGVAKQRVTGLEEARMVDLSAGWQTIRQVGDSDVYLPLSYVHPNTFALAKKRASAPQSVAPVAQEEQSVEASTSGSRVLAEPDPEPELEERDDAASYQSVYSAARP